MMLQKIKDNWRIVLPAFVAICSILDLTFTIIALYYTTSFYEANPFMAFMFEHYGIATTSIFKLINTAFQCWVAWWVVKMGKQNLTIFMSSVMVGVYGFLMIWWFVCWMIFLLGVK